MRLDQAQEIYDKKLPKDDDKYCPDCEDEVCTCESELLYEDE